MARNTCDSHQPLGDRWSIMEPRWTTAATTTTTATMQTTTTTAASATAMLPTTSATETYPTSQRRGSRDPPG
eukprot:8399825-Pyramimonas_sp.AAC.1